MVRLFGLSKKSSKNDSNDFGSTVSRFDGSRGNMDSESSEEAPDIASELQTIKHSNNNKYSIHDEYSIPEEPSTRSSSVFSRSRCTYGSSSISTRSNSDGQGNIDNVGKPLRVIDHKKLSSLNTVSEEDANELATSLEERSVPTSKVHSSRALRSEQVEKELVNLEENFAELMDDIHQNVTNISKAVIEAIEFFKKFMPTFSGKLPSKVSFEKNSSLRAIAKMTLHFLDNLLASEVYGNSRSILMRRYIQFLKKLNIPIDKDQNSQTLPYMANFCIDAECNLPQRENINKIIEELSIQDSSLMEDQEGAFIAPILRGLSRKSAILTVMFGVPEPYQKHYEIVNALYSLFPDVHFFCVKDHIRPCADIMDVPAVPMEFELPKTSIGTSFIPPYRLATNAFEPPISMSLSSDHSLKSTGTLGGYLFPQIEENHKLSQFSGSSFAITCSHVVLSEAHDYPHVSTPSKVLQTAYRSTLLEENQRYQQGSQESKAFLEEVARVEAHMKWQDENKFGQVVWGERSIIDHKLSDFAIIKVDKKFKCENCLGAGLTTAPDPTLRFRNMYVKEKILKYKPGLQVFKIGASTNYTSGQVNATKLVYWADGALQSSEFVVSSPLPLFASAGDSGSWILTKLENQPGLGCVGMLHSYDGEQKQFGLFTPIGEIVQRLQAVTGVLWDIDVETN